MSENKGARRLVIAGGADNDRPPVEFFLRVDGSMVDVCARVPGSEDSALIAWFSPGDDGIVMHRSSDSEDLAPLGFKLNGDSEVEIEE